MGLFTFSDPVKVTRFANKAPTPAYTGVGLGFDNSKGGPGPVATPKTTRTPTGVSGYVPATPPKPAVSPDMRSAWTNRLDRANMLAQQQRQAAAAQQQADTNPNWASQVDAYARAMTGTDSALSNLNLSSSISDAQYVRASASARLADIDAQASAANDRLIQDLKRTGDLKKYYADKFALDQQTADLKQSALADMEAANQRQPGMIAGKRQSVDNAYNTDLGTLATQESQVTLGRDKNLDDRNSSAVVSGAYGAAGYDRDRSNIASDWRSAMDLIGQDRERLTQKRIDSIRDLDEAAAVVTDNTKAYQNELAQLNVARQMSVLEYWKNIGDIDNNLANSKITAKQAAGQKAAAQQQAAADNAKASAMERDAQQKHAIEQKALDDKQNTLRWQAAASGMFGKPPTSATTSAPVTAGAINPGQAKMAREDAAYKPPAFGQPGNPLTPNLARDPRATNPLGINDGEWNKVVYAAGLSGGGDPVKTYSALVGYMQWFQSIMPPAPVQRPTKFVA